ncbi:metallophosphoesterase [Corynebacterium sp. TAE3-ERU12]|uniref:metallophosphoesterase family protein n=1 Tax=Corynebacterium sp. TAE3-ERU12 TaxID=2849491 RepID=UPI001C452BFD|nr:metallophosphoesterase [Corynebacterium sp. TAE3-ERU12]MBV7295250.1 metallophosphoesterase [Corynebacterium sp. TAE3-ERU12]
MPDSHTPTLWAVADLHVAVRENRKIAAKLYPPHPDDWLIVAGDVAERPELVLSTLTELAQRYAQVIWAPGNHELFCRGTDRHVGEDRYRQLVDGCRAIGVLTPEDPFPQFGDTTVCPLFTLYDYSLRPAGTTIDEALARAYHRQVVLNDEFAIKPFVDPVLWCRRRLAYTVRRMASVSGPTILINHWPLVREPLEALAFPEIAMWCGTRHTQDWPTRYDAHTVVFGHLHIPGEITVDGVKHVEVSLGYPRQWRQLPADRTWPYPVMEAA